MASRLCYISGTTGQRVELDGDKLFTDTAAPIRGRRVSYDLGYRSIKNVLRPAQEFELTLFAINREELDYAREVFERDLFTQEFGEFEACGVWRTRVCVVAQSIDSVDRARISAKLTVLFFDPMWSKAHSLSFYPVKDSGGAGFLDAGYDLEYDLKKPAKQASLENVSAWRPSPFIMRIYGPAANPYVIIAKNRYQVNAQVPAGGYLEINSQAKTAEITDAQGSKTNVFADAQRKGGAHGGSYIFEPIPAGFSQVSWDNSFGFDLVYFEQEPEVPWNSY